MDDQLREDTLTAIAVVTASNGEQGNPKTLAANIANEYVDEHPGDGHSRLLNGFIQLAIVLLAKIKHDTGASPEDALLDAADLVNNWSDEE